MYTSDKFNPQTPRLPNLPPPVDTRLGIFKKRFRCRVPYIETLSVDEIRLHGMPASGYEDLDRSVANDLVDRYYSIADMVDFMRRGVTIRIPKYDDTKRIYECIQAHLLAWRDELIEQRSANYAPLEDLIDLDKLAAIVYNKAKYVFKTHNAQDFTTRSLESLFEGSLRPDFGSLSQDFGDEIPDIDTNDDGLGAHQSLEDLFVSRMTR